MSAPTDPMVDWEARARAAEQTVEVLKAKVQALYDQGAHTAVHRQLDRARQRAHAAEIKRARLEAERAQLVALNAVLEDRVASRTRALRLVLDHVASGFLVIDRQLVVQEGFSEACHRLLGRAVTAGDGICQALGLDGDAALALELALTQVFDDLLPEEVALAQVPGRLVIGDRVLHLSASTIRTEAVPSSILLSLQDGTELEQARSEGRRHAAIVGILRQRTAFERFLTDARESLASARRMPHESTVRRVIHTLKGNASAFGLDDVVHVCHRVEEEPRIGTAALDRVEAALRGFVATNLALLAIDYEAVDGHGPVVVHRRDFDRLTAIARRLADPLLAAWQREVTQVPFQLLLGPLPEFAKSLGHRLGKPLSFTLIGAQVLVDPRAVAPVVRALAHLVQNAVDHGIEPTWERHDKSQLGQLALSLSDHATEWRLVLRDDGRGVDTDALVRRAVALGVITDANAHLLSPTDRLNLIFVEGLSVNETPTEVSGRGVGMSAVLQAVQASNGRIEVASAAGRGTTIEVVIPKPTELQASHITIDARRLPCASS
ncbi:MAG: Hpt domain-containing protein [Myxococcales bacterium]|nr:Hpt domain-containing protein [Myxococcales bacterium]